MKTKLAALFAAVLLSGCLATPGPSPSEVSAFWADHNARLEKTRNGEAKRSDVFRQSYAKMAAMPATYDQHVFLWMFNEYIGISTKMESGEITKEQAEDLARAVQTEARSRTADAKARNDALIAQQQAASAARAAATSQILQQWQANQPRPQMPINCTTQRLGTVINTQCN